MAKDEPPGDGAEEGNDGKTEKPIDGDPSRRPLRPREDPPPNMPPMPKRLPPFVLEPHEVRPELDVDWTLSEDIAVELRSREIRNDMIKEKLQAGRSIVYRSSGWSLYPTVHANDACTYDPVNNHDEVWPADIVFCQVQPNDRDYAHLVLDEKWSDKWNQFVYTIGNMKGRENGWCYLQHIYGRLVDVSH